MEDFTTSPFDAIQRIDEHGREYWSAQDLRKILGYSQYTKFKNVIRKAEKACEESGEGVSDHFIHLDEVIEGGKGAARQRLEREQPKTRRDANTTHYQVGKRVRDLIIEQGGTVPEQLPTPKKSSRQLEREEQQRMDHKKRPSLFSPENDQRNHDQS